MPQLQPLVCKLFVKLRTIQPIRRLDLGHIEPLRYFRHKRRQQQNAQKGYVLIFRHLVLYLLLP
jgi:hypothetical protein